MKIEPINIRIEVKTITGGHLYTVLFDLNNKAGTELVLKNLQTTVNDGAKIKVQEPWLFAVIDERRSYKTIRLLQTLVNMPIEQRMQVKAACNFKMSNRQCTLKSVFELLGRVDLFNAIFPYLKRDIL